MDASPPIVLISPARQTSSGGPLAGSITVRLHTMRVPQRDVHPQLSPSGYDLSLPSSKIQSMRASK
ncbi:hypothetical protein ABG768_008863 [Culter alburnus]|uniref:Uncharacterized protein n=1 Tax=Culter alburnus TaxID=194366 RepID=A0AAW1ZLW0_CULAL